MTSPAPCRLCGAEISAVDSHGYHLHPSNDCLFSGFEISSDDVAKWNRRPAPMTGSLTDEQSLEFAKNFGYMHDGLVRWFEFTDEQFLRTYRAIERETLERAAREAERFFCGGCGLDGKASAAIRSLIKY